jgi:hypothetical protein
MCNMHHLDLEFLWQVEEHPEDSAMKLAITLHQREKTQRKNKTNRGGRVGTKNRIYQTNGRRTNEDKVGLKKLPTKEFQAM